MKRILTGVWSLFHLLPCLAQLPVQVFGGHQAVEYNFLWYKDIDKNQRVNLFNFTYFTLDHKDRNRNTYEIYQVATYMLNRHWGIAGGGRFTAGTFIPQVALSYEIKTKNLYLNVFPTLQWMEDATDGHHKPGFSVFGLLFYTPRLNERWNGFGQLMFEPLADRQAHIYSYQQIRLGFEYRSLFQFGIGANLEQIGRDYEWRENYGLFIRKELH